MVVGSKAEDELLGMTREELEKEMLKMPAQKRFREFYTHLASTEAEWGDGAAAGEAGDLAKGLA
jgi:hypothetical protein